MPATPPPIDALIVHTADLLEKNTKRFTWMSCLIDLRI